MPIRYTPLPIHTSTQDSELEASFEGDDSDVEDHDDSRTESQLLNPTRSHSPPPPATTSGSAPYNFEHLDYDYPPPGSPPRPSTVALPHNVIGNSNGYIPQMPQIPRPEQRTGWFRRAAGAILPPSIAASPTNSRRPVGGGIENDGVFANINAKPGRGRIVQDDGSGVHVVPEEVQKEAPPSYASAQADAVPPYWETTIHAPAGDAGEVMVDGLPTGSLFSFLWNLLVSMSFQFVGFLLTFLLHSTHAAKLGSRAGLGITLIHYGFYLRTRSSAYSNGGVNAPDAQSADVSWWPSSTSPSHPVPTFSTAAEADGYYSKHPFANDTLFSSPTSSVIQPGFSEGTSEWVSFLLMTMGWFILLTSTLTFWRVKRWERSIIASTPPPTEAIPDEGPSYAHNSFFALGRFGFPGAMWPGFRGNASAPEGVPYDEEAMIESNEEQAHMLPRPDDPESIERAGRYALVRVSEARLQQELRTAGLI